MVRRGTAHQAIEPDTATIEFLPGMVLLDFIGGASAGMACYNERYHSSTGQCIGKLLHHLVYFPERPAAA